MSEPLKTTQPVTLFEELLDHLDAALAPRVVFSEDTESMRKEAEALRVSEIENAARIIFNNIGGLRERPLRERLIWTMTTQDGENAERS